MRALFNFEVIQGLFYLLSHFLNLRALLSKLEAVLSFNPLSSLKLVCQLLDFLGLLGGSESKVLLLFVQLRYLVFLIFKLNRDFVSMVLDFGYGEGSPGAEGFSCESCVDLALNRDELFYLLPLSCVFLVCPLRGS